MLKYGKLQSETAIDRANFKDASDYLEKIAKNTSEQKEWKYTSKESVCFYLSNRIEYWHSYTIEKNPERILCAAVHFPETFTYSNGNLQSQEIPKPLGIKSGTVIAGRRHGDCYAVYLALTGNRKIENSIDGFLTVSNKFIDRTEAFQIAKLAKQLLSHVDRNSNWLCSEMLYFD